MIKDQLEQLINEEGNYEQEFNIAMHYNEIFQYPELCSQIRISNHHRILQMAIKHENENENKINYDELISFIIGQLEKRKYNMNILLELIDPNQLTKSSIIKILECPNIDDSFMNTRILFLRMLKNVDAQQHIIKDTITSQFEVFRSEINQNIASQIEEIKQTLSNQIQEKYDLIKKTVEVNKKEISNITSKFDVIFNKVNQITKDLSVNSNNMKNEISEIKKQISKTIEDTKKENDQILTLIENMKNSTEIQKLQAEMKKADEERKRIETAGTQNTEQLRQQYAELKQNHEQRFAKQDELNRELTTHVSDTEAALQLLADSGPYDPGERLDSTIVFFPMRDDDIDISHVLFDEVLSDQSDVPEKYKHGGNIFDRVHSSIRFARKAQREAKVEKEKERKQRELELEERRKQIAELQKQRKEDKAEAEKKFATQAEVDRRIGKVSDWSTTVNTRDKERRAEIQKLQAEMKKAAEDIRRGEEERRSSNEQLKNIDMRIRELTQAGQTLEQRIASMSRRHNGYDDSWIRQRIQELTDATQAAQNRANRAFSGALRAYDFARFAQGNLNKHEQRSRGDTYTNSNIYASNEDFLLYTSPRFREYVQLREELGDLGVQLDVAQYGEELPIQYLIPDQNDSHKRVPGLYHLLIPHFLRRNIAYRSSSLAKIKKDSQFPYVLTPNRAAYQPRKPTDPKK